MGTSQSFGSFVTLFPGSSQIGAYAIKFTGANAIAVNKFGTQNVKYRFAGDSSWTTLTDGAGSGFHLFTLASGLTEGTTYLMFVTGAYFNTGDTTDVLFEATGSSAPTFFAAITDIGSPWTSMRLDGNYTSFTQQSRTGAIWATPGACMRFNAINPSGLMTFWVENQSGGFMVTKDGVQIGSDQNPPGATTPSDSDTSGDIYFIQDSSPDSSSHLFEIVPFSLPLTSELSPKVFALFDFGIDAGATLGSTPAAKQNICTYGDSILAGITATDYRTVALYVAARALGYAPAGMGFPFKGIVNSVAGSNPDYFLRDNTGQITGVSPQPKYIFLMGGRNDLSVGGGDFSNGGTEQTAMTTMLNDITTADPTAIVFVLGILPRDTYGTDYITPNACWVRAIAAATAPSQFTYVDDTAWFNMGGADSTDGLHLNDTGQSGGGGSSGSGGTYYPSAAGGSVAQVSQSLLPVVPTSSPVCAPGAVYSILTGALCPISAGTVVVPATSAWFFPINLPPASKGAQVKLLQKFLNA